MNRSIVGLAALGACLVVPTFASAQEAGKIGVTMGFPASVGIIWHATEKVAVRPEFTFTHSSTEASGGETSSTSCGTGVSVLFYAAKWDNAAAYFAPRFAWAHGNGESRGNSGILGAESSSDAYTFTGSFGAQGWIGSRFSVFGEVGLSFTDGSSENSFSVEPLETQSFGLRGGAGAVFYF
jgi:hypothetical protein